MVCAGGSKALNEISSTLWSYIPTWRRGNELAWQTGCAEFDPGNGLFFFFFFVFFLNLSFSFLFFKLLQFCFVS